MLASFKSKIGNVFCPAIFLHFRMVWFQLLAKTWKCYPWNYVSYIYIFRSPCLHGTCSNINNYIENLCICEEGWKGDSCDICVPYWNCPNQGQDACLFPNECHCSPGQNDTNGLCFHEDLDKSGIESSAVIGSCLDNICQIDGSIRIIEGYEFSDKLLDPNSVEYKDLKQMIEEEVRTCV